MPVITPRLTGHNTRRWSGIIVRYRNFAPGILDQRPSDFRDTHGTPHQQKRVATMLPKPCEPARIIREKSRNKDVLSVTDTAVSSASSDSLNTVEERYQESLQRPRARRVDLSLTILNESTYVVHCTGLKGLKEALW